MRTAPISAALLALVLLAPQAPAADEPKGDLALLQGSWSAKVGPEKNIPITLTIKGNDVDLAVARPDGQEARLKGEIKIDDKASPRTVDFLKFSTPGGDDVPTNLGLYKLEGDNWTVCSGGPGNDRPTKFEGGEGAPPTLTTWMRVKPAAAEKPPEGDLAKFQGAWTARAEGADLAIDLEIKGNAVTAKWARGDGTDVDLRGELRLNDKASPPTIDFFHFKDATGEAMKDNLGVYKIDGETIRLAVGGAGNERPADLKAEGGEGSAVLTLTRKKKG